MFDQLDLGVFKDLNYYDLSKRTITIGGILAAHPKFQTDWPAFLTKPDALIAMGGDLTVAAEAAISKDTGKIAYRNALRVDVETALQLVGGYIILKSLGEKDPSILHTCGFDLIHRTYNKAPKSKEPPPVPGKVRAKHGLTSGTVLLGAQKVPRAVIIELQMSIGEPAGEESWNVVGRYATYSKIAVEGLELGKRHYFRMRGEGDNTIGPWCTPVSLIVI